MPYPKSRIMDQKGLRTSSTGSTSPVVARSKPTKHVRSQSCPDSSILVHRHQRTNSLSAFSRPTHSSMHSCPTSIADFVTAEDILASRMAARLAVARLEATVAAEERQRKSYYSQASPVSSIGWSRTPSLPQPRPRPEAVSHHTVLHHHRTTGSLRRPQTPPSRSYTVGHRHAVPQRYERPLVVGSTVASSTAPSRLSSQERDFMANPALDVTPSDTYNEGDRCFIDSITDVDILCGRGGKSNHHPGNKKYRQVVGFMKYKYQNCPAKTQKTDLSRQIVEYCHSYGGRFVKKDSGNSRYYVLTKDEARKKTSQALRETKVLKWTA